MELVQEVYEQLQRRSQQWPEYAVIVVKDYDGEIKFSSVGKFDVTFHPEPGIYMRGENCMFNNLLVEDLQMDRGISDHPSLVTRSEYEDYYFCQENSK